MITYKLNNNTKIPCIGFGTWKLKNDESTISIIKNALNTGYTHFDTAKAYNNEEAIGEGLKQASIDRKNLFITGKLWNDDKLNGSSSIINACKESIKKLNCEYLDLYLIHWPASKALYSNWEDINNETWKALEYLYLNGYVKAIGVCNFKKHHLESLIKSAKIKPMVNQIELHPGFFDKDLINFCKNNNILVEAWSPLGSGKLIKNQELIKIANKYNVSVAQLCIKWCLQNGVIPLPKTKNLDRMKENLDVFNFTISDEDIEILKTIEAKSSGLDSDTITIFN